MAQRGPSSPRGRRLYIKGIGAVGSNSSGSFVWRTAPQRRVKTQTRAQLYATATLGVAARFVKLATAWEYQAAKDLAGQSGYTWKDMLIASFYGTAIEFTDVNGLTWYSKRELAMNIQQLLDSISSTAGSILVRTTNGWAALYPGDPNSTLTLRADTGLPDWIPPDTSGGGASAISASDAFVPPKINLKGSTTFALNNFGSRAMWLPQGATINAVKLFCQAAAPTAKITAAIYKQTLGTANTLAAQGSQVTGVVQGINSFPITYTVPASDWYYCGVQALVASISVATSLSVLDDYFFAASGALPSSAPTGTYNGGIAWNSMWLGHT